MQKTIFVIDDSKMNLIVVKDALKDQYRVIPLPSAAKMFSLMEKLTPDIILLDILMPEMDGYEAIKLLKRNSAHANIPVIFLTSTIDESTKEQGYQLGASDFVLKPFEKTELLEKIARALE
ncbi:MAG: response regulator [Treponema sp.]|nr:response regulator [Treponema sp.]